MNQCHFMGRVARDPELKTFASGSRVVNFSLAVDRFFKKDDDRVKETSFLEMEAWDTGADTIAKYVTKGKPLVVICEVKTDNWTDKQSGEKRSKLKFRVEKFHFVPDGSGKGKRNEPADETPNDAPANDDVGDTSGDGEIPF